MVTQYLPHYAGSPIVCGKPGAVSGATGQHMVKARAGHHLAPAPLPDGADLWNTLGAGFTLMMLGGDARLANGFISAAQQRGIPLKTLDLASARLMDLYEAEAILIRPDHFVAWAGSAAAADAATILDRATGQFGDET